MDFAFSASRPVRSGASKSSACEATKNSIARIVVTLARIGRYFSASAMPMLT